MIAIFEMKYCSFGIVAWLGLLSIFCRTLQVREYQKLSLEKVREGRKEKGEVRRLFGESHKGKK